MYKLFLISLLFLLLNSCKSDKNKIRDIIGETYVNNTLTKLKDLPIKKDHILNFPFNLYFMENNIELSEDDDFRLVRYVFSIDDDGKYVMFYIVNFKDNTILDKSSDYDNYEKYFKSFSNSEKDYKLMESYYRGDVILE